MFNNHRQMTTEAKASTTEIWHIKDKKNMIQMENVTLQNEIYGWIEFRIQSFAWLWDSHPSSAGYGATSPSTPCGPRRIHSWGGAFLFKLQFDWKHRKNGKCCPGHYLIVNRYSSISWFKFRNLSVIVNCVTNSLNGFQSKSRLLSL